MFNRHPFRLLGMLAILAVIGAACSAGTPTATTPTTDAEASDEVEAVELAGDSAAIEVEVTLTEFAIEMSQSEFEVGVPYVFTVKNEGSVEHEMMVVPPIEPGAMDMEEMDELALLLFEAEDLPPGGVVSQTITFTEVPDVPLEAACFIPGHYEAGMVTGVSVSG